MTGDRADTWDGLAVDDGLDYAHNSTLPRVSREYGVGSGESALRVGSAMGSIVVCGGSVIGSCVAAMLGRDGHRVTVLEADPTPPPAIPLDAWDGWERKGVPQFHQAHNLFARFRGVADRELPGLTSRLVDAGCAWIDPLADMPPSIADRSARGGDEIFRFVTGRRPVVEAARDAIRRSTSPA